MAACFSSKETNMRIYVACLASYNNGRLHGDWIDASTDADAMQEEVNAMLRKSPCPNVEVECPDCDGTGATVVDGTETLCKTCNGRKTVPSAEEWAIHDYDGKWPNFGEHCGLKVIAEYMQLIEAADGRGIDEDDVAAIVDHYGAHYLEEAQRAIDENYCGHYRNLEDYAEQFIEDTMDSKAIPEQLRYYIDYAKMGRDWELSGDIFTVDASDGGIHVFHSN
jgi:antirestriction protein